MLESFNLGEFKYKKLTEAEQQKRGILGRLVGIIADTNNATRNGRKYGLDLWKKVFDDPLMKEKIANRCVFSELGHPLDREEIDMSKVCACLAEQPKLGADGKLYGVFDILDLPNGRILKTLCDYGTNIGVSSRGSGDIMANDEVDPDTYNCECFDIVVVPAVKEARLSYMTESLNTKEAKLKKALKESYEAATEEDKKIMKETLDNLDIELSEAKCINEDDIPWAADELVLDENADIPDEEAIEDVEETDADEAELDVVDLDEEEDPDDVDAEDEEDAADKSEESAEESSAETIADLVKELKEYDKNNIVEFAPIEIDDKVYEVTSMELDDSEEGKVIVTIGYTPEMEDNIDEHEVDEEEEVVENEEVDEQASAEDTGEKEVIESLKELIRQKDGLVEELRALKNERAVNDVEVNSLKEELEKYKAAFRRTSQVAAKATLLEKNVNQLHEQLEQKTVAINKLQKENSIKLTESANLSAGKIEKLTEELSFAKNELEEKTNQLTEQVNIYKTKLNERTQMAAQYKNKCAELTEKYISFRASILGVRPVEISNRLTENYTITDIDSVCEHILTEGNNLGRLPYGFNSNTKIEISGATKEKRIQTDGYEIDDSLLELAGLK